MVDQMILEVTDVTELDLEKSPPCETVVTLIFNVMRTICAQPAVIRVYTKCPTCELSGYTFYCRPHYDALQVGLIQCIRCDTVLFNHRHGQEA